MKLDNKVVDVEGGFGLKTYESSISEAKLNKLWDMLQNPYKNNIGSIVREITSNCFDAHKEINTNDAVRIKFGKDESGLYISFIDVGVGLSPERVDTIYRNYLESTKEDSNDFIGSYGIGSKSPLSYQDLFYINTRFDGIEYHYIMSKGETKPSIDLIEEKFTAERNGTEIKLYIKDETDLIKFLNEACNQLYYFDNVVFDLEEIEAIYNTSYYYNSTGYLIKEAAKYLKKDYYIIEGDHFKIRTDVGYNELHLTIGSVRYPIDWQNLGISRINFPVALKFEIGDLSVIYTREDIRYTESNIKKIKDKIELLKEELIEKYNREDTLIYDNYFQFANIDNDLTLTLNKDTEQEINLYLNNILDKDSINKLNTPQLEGFPYTFKNREEIISIFSKLKSIHISDNKNNPLFNFKVDKKFTTNGSMNSNTTDSTLIGYKLSFIPFREEELHQMYTFLNNFKNSIESNHRSKLFISKNRNYTVKKNRYIFEKLYTDLYYGYVFILTDFKLNLSYSLIKNYLKKLNGIVDNKTAIAILNYYIEKFKEIFNDVIEDYDAIKVDEIWWKEKLKEAKENRGDYDRSLMAIERVYANPNVTYDRKDTRISLHDYLTKDSYRSTIRILIDKSSDEVSLVGNANESNTKLESLINIVYRLRYSNIKPKRLIEVHLVSNRNFKKIIENRQDNSGIYTYKEFMNDKKVQTKILGRIYTLYKLKQEFPQYFSFLNTRDSEKIINDIFNKELVADYNEIKGILYQLSNLYNLSFIEDLISDCDNINDVTQLYDTELVNKFNKLIVLYTDHHLQMYNYDPRDMFLFIHHFEPKSTYYRFNEIFYKPLENVQDIVNLIENKDVKEQYQKLIDESKLDEGNILNKIYEQSGYYYRNLEYSVRVLAFKQLNKINKKQFKIENND